MIKSNFIIAGLLSMAMLCFSQEKENLVDAHVLSETQLKGKAEVGKSKMSEYATDSDINDFVSRVGDSDFYLFPETRQNSIRLLDGIASDWSKRDKSGLESLNIKAQPGEELVFQIGVFAYQKSLNNIKVKISEFKGKSGKLSKNKVTCFNTEGIDQNGKYFTKKLSVEKSRVQPLWFAVTIPKNMSGNIAGVVTVSADGVKKQKVSVNINISGDIVKNSGYNNGNSLSRLSWLNSKVAQDDDIVKGYTPIKVTGNSFEILGRKVDIAKSGLPKMISSSFDKNNHTLKSSYSNILSDEMQFVVETESGRKINLKPKGIKFTKVSEGQVRWKSVSKSKEITLTVNAMAEFDGFMNYTVTVKSRKNINIKDIRLEVPMTKTMSKYLMGMNKEGGFRPETLNWKWNVASKSQDAVWVGGVNGGLRVKLKGKNYHRQLVNVYYKFNPLSLPKSWGNDGKGGTDIVSSDKGAVIKAYSGDRNMKKGESLNYDFELLITPLKLINRDIQYNDRYYHSNRDVSTSFIPNAHKSGANIINIHHKKDINPFINYPYLPENVPSLTKFVNDAHKKGIRTKVYYTTRELTVNTPEIWAMRSLGDEVIFPGPGKDAKTVVNRKGPHPWLVKNFKDNFIPAWKCTFREGPYKGRQDLSVITTPDSRLNNFYLAGLDWMCKYMNIDGIYIDDSALDRVTLKRAKKILERNRPNARIDMHTWNHFNGMAGHACCLNLYMDLLPYYDHLWIGEGRSYDKSTDYWLVETSGIPFGLTSQMLQHGGNRWRGMIFGITNRLGWYGPTPEYIWNFWDKYNIQDKTMTGFWNDECPVTTNNKDMIATVYKGKDSAIISVANWTKKPISGKLNIDFKSLGLDESKVKMVMPAIKEFQDEKPYKTTDTIDIEGGKGFLIVVSQ